MKRTSEQSSNDVQGISTTTKKPAMDTTDANKNRALRCSSIEKELVFEIDEFSKKTEVIESPIFHGPTNSTRWSLQVDPHGTAGGNGEFITVFLILKDYSPVQVHIAYNFRIGQRYPNVGYHRRTFKMAGDSCGHIVICRAMLFEPTNGFLVDDKLIITCRMVANNPMMYDNVFLSDLERAFAEDDLKDCELIGNDGTVRACKALLSSQSRVFSRMFQGELKEAETDKVDNVGFDQTVLTELVRYTHCGKTGDIKEIAEDLFEAADKYEIKPLMALCAQHMRETLTKENVCARLVIADRHCVNSLKNAAITVIKENISDIKELVDYKELLTTEHQDLVIEIFNAIARK